MDKIKRFVDCTVPVLTCNMRCPYCYITQERKFLSALPNFQYDAETIGRAFVQDRWGGVIHINMCGGGETLLPPEMTSIIYEILKQGHYIAIVTNGTVTKRFEEICRFPREFCERLLFKFSFHYLQLKEKKLLDKFFANIEMVKKAGCSFSLELTPSDEYIPYIKEIQRVCKERVGAYCHVTVARDENDPELPILTSLSRDKYLKTWESFDSDLFKFKMQTFNVKRKEFCYAGEWTAHLNLGTGILKQCYCGAFIQNIFEDVSRPIKWEPIGCNCAEPHCHNAHVWLTLGAIPALETPTYASMRDRMTDDGEHWLQPRMREFISGKLKDNNEQHTENEKKKINRKMWVKVGISYKTYRLARSLFYKLPDKTKIGLLKKFKRSKA